MLSKTLCYALSGIDGLPITVECGITPGTPGFEIVGLPDTAVKESRERIRSAVSSSGIIFPPDRIIINLAPADIRKESSAFDLPVAIAILASSELIPAAKVEHVAFMGELALDGSLRPVRGALPLVISARENGVKTVVLPKVNACEVTCVEGIEIIAAESLIDVIKHITGRCALEPVKTVKYEELLRERVYSNDFKNVKGQASAKRALTIAAAGGHNVLMVGAPGSGKTLMARCMPSILPDMSFEEALTSTRIHSAAGLSIENGLLTERPFRAPHHTASHVSIIGGGKLALPGEISKAHNGILFLDETVEFKKDSLEALRQPMEDGFVTVTRINAQSTYPAEFMLVCAINPCPCGMLGSRTKQCRCTPNEVKRYLGRMSGPLLDRIDIHIEVESIPPEKLAETSEGQSSAEMKLIVEKARTLQRERYKEDKIPCNARLGSSTISKYCKLTKSATKLLNVASERMGFSNRSYTRIIKVARTIADIDGAEAIDAEQISEALQYRVIDEKYWG